MQISDCSSDDRTKIKQSLTADEPSPTVFAVVQTATFRSLKFTWYPQFVQLPIFRSILKASVYCDRVIFNINYYYILIYIYINIKLLS